MCLELHFKTGQEAKEAFENPSIADEDIICWKMLDVDPSGKLVSPFQGMIYEPGFVYYQTDIPFVGNIDRYFFQIPVYTTGSVRSYAGTSVEQTHFILTITEGLHSYRSNKKPKRIAALYDNRVVKKMIIPKGSKYFSSDVGDEYCSDQILFPHK